MKYTRLFVAAALCALAASCAKESSFGGDPQGIEIRQISASWAGDGDKTVLAEDGVHVLWSPDDEINVFYNTVGVKFTALNAEPVDQTIFASSQALIFGGTEGYNKKYLYGIYPYSASNAQRGEELTLTVPGTQTALEGSFQRGAFPSVGRSKDTSMAFYNVCGGVCFTLTQSGIRRIKFSGNDGENLAGKVKVAFNAEGRPVVTDVIDTVTTIILDAPDSGEFQTGKKYYLSALPCVLSKGYTMEFQKREDLALRGRKVETQSRETKRSIFSTLSGADSGVEYSVEVVKLTLDRDTLTMKKKTAMQLTCTVSPSDASYTSLEWKSSDKSVAMMHEDSVVLAMSVGECDVTVTSDNGTSAVCHVSVIDWFSEVTTGSPSDVTAYGATLTASLKLIKTQYETLSYGFYWGYSPDDLNNVLPSDNFSEGVFSSRIASLTKDIYFRAFANVDGEEVFGDVKKMEIPESVFTVNIDNGSKGTKASFDPATGNLSFEKGDELFFSDRKVSYKVAVPDAAAGKGSCEVKVKAIFDGSLVCVLGAGSVLEQGNIMVDLPKSQADGLKNVILTANSTVSELSLKPQSSLVKVSLTDAADTRLLTLRANGGQQIAGKFNIDEDGSLISAGSATALSEVSVDCNGDGEYYLAVAPCTLSEGPTVIGGNQSGYAIFSKSTSKSIIISKGTICNMGTFSVVVSDLSSDDTANSYIVPFEGTYKFNASVKGNSKESVGTPATAEVLWETFGTAVAPNVGEIVSPASYKDGYVQFSTPSTLRNGNAVIAVKDASGNILWSWHIWICKGYQPTKDNQHVYKNSAGVMMDRNLGATSATKGDVGALGLLYQWGRKDPFLGGRQITYDSSGTQKLAASTLSWPSAVSSTSSQGTIAYAVAHPTTFIYYNENNSDWQYSQDDTRWQSSKTMYDPCPSGWRVPDGGETGVWYKAFAPSLFPYLTGGPWDSGNRGMNFGSGNGYSSSYQLGSALIIWYPVAGYRFSKNGKLVNIGDDGSYWSCTPKGNNAYTLSLHFTAYIYPARDYSRAYGQSVRCLSE